MVCTACRRVGVCIMFNYTKYVLKKQYYSFTIYVSSVDLLFSEKYRFLLVKYDIL